MVKVFIVEDDPLMIRMYEKALRLNKYQVEMAFNGKEALEKLRLMKPKPTLILLDIMMPGLSGFEVLKEIKRDPTLKKIPVVALTNLAGPEDAEKALSLGAVLYLIKSQYDPKEVIEKVKEIVGGYTHGEDLPETKVAVKDIKTKKPEKKHK